ncbi:MAG: hypothetical protein DHS20C15_07390 [Planctomycetota bacterium]|nr:MAG: hypothetical protein DHS20C15_07390 [Planctomycetota bacterium]
MLKRAAEAGAELAGLDARAAARLADREHGPALFSVVDRPPPLAGPLPATGPLLLVGLCGLQDPGNVGTLLRSARAFGAHGVLLGEGGVDPGNPKVLRASAGAALGLPLGRLEQLPQWLDGADLALRAALAPGSEERATLHAREERGAGSAQIEAAGGAGRSAEGGRRPQALDEVASSENPASVVPGPPSRVLLLLGHETRGVQSALATLGPDAPVEAWSLRQEPEVESLNVGVAGSILMADWYRRWR